MSAIFRQISAVTSRPNSGWLTLMLLLAVLVPSACLIWFMNQAVRNERLAVRQQLTEVYRGNLSLAQERLEVWRAQMTSLAETNNLPIDQLLRDGRADAVADVKQTFSYPTNLNAAATALQENVRGLNEAGKRRAAAILIIDAVGSNKLAEATDERGRLILPNLELMALEFTNAPNLLAALAAELNDYTKPMPSSQRRFLMRRLAELFPSQTHFPTLAAEELAARYLETSPEPVADATIKATAIPGVWQLSSARGRVVFLFKTETLQARLREAASAPAIASAVNLSILTPQSKAGNFLMAIPAGDAFPDWQLALALKDGDVFKTAASEQIASYVWVGVLTMAVVIVLAVFGAGLIRRQAAVARLRNDLLANVTHELKTPLSSMRLLVDTLLQSKPLREETAREYLELIAAENLRLSRLIDNFLTFSRIERNKISFDFIPVPAGAIAERAAAAVRERFAAGGCRFDLQTAAALPLVAADADAMVTVLLNLLDNAWKYSGDEKRITLSAAARNGSVLFAVKDNGIGLAPRETKRIFRRFYQVDQRLARTGGGCGLGLSIVQFIVNAHSGFVRVESEPGQGSKFTVVLPAAREART